MNRNRKVSEPCDPRKRNVVIWGEDGILSWTVESILRTRTEWCVVRSEEGGGWFGLLGDIRGANAEVVILYHFDTAENARLALDLMAEFPDLKIIAVNPEDNEMHVYSRQLMCVNQAADLLFAIEQ